MTVSVAAVDLGASNGRVMRADVGRDTLDLTEVARFDNVPIQAGGTLHWDAPRLRRAVEDGLRAAGPVDAIGVDAWGVDFGLIDAEGRPLGNPVHYRDTRVDGVMERALSIVEAERIYARTGIQFLPFNTVFQLIAARDRGELADAAMLLLMPDLVGHWLTGSVGAERTNASTTQLLDVHTGGWSADLIGELGLPPTLFPPLREPGSTVGTFHDVPVVAVGSHDTASAVAAVPAKAERFAYVSCGTWSLVGVELDRPVLTAASREANFTNEAGLDGTIRYLRNVVGLWPLQECLRAWGSPDLPRLLDEAARAPAFAAVLSFDDPTFLAPGDMPARIAAACRYTGQRAPEGRAGTVRSIMDSLALAHARALADAQRLSGKAVDVVHVVGGGAANPLLCQLTADACGVPVEAGPREATALGNALVQGRALGAVPPDLAAMRALVRATQPVLRYEPRGDPGAWAAAAARLMT